MDVALSRRAFVAAKPSLPPLRGCASPPSSIMIAKKRRDDSSAGLSFAGAGVKESSSAGIDFSDPEWKAKYQNDFEEQFGLPRVTDLFPDAAPIPSTFCLRMRTSILENFFVYPSDEE